MSDDVKVREAAGRLRTLASADDLKNTAYWKPGSSPNYPQVSCDRATLADAYLREDDETPVDKAWLKSLPQETCDQILWHKITFGGIWTRGRARTLCRALSIPLKESPDHA